VNASPRARALSHQPIGGTAPEPGKTVSCSGEAKEEKCIKEGSAVRTFESSTRAKKVSTPLDLSSREVAEDGLEGERSIAICFGVTKGEGVVFDDEGVAIVGCADYGGVLDDEGGR
jgi:hypothetical protein